MFSCCSTCGKRPCNNRLQYRIPLKVIRYNIRLQVDDDVQSLRDECARLRGNIEKRDGSIADYRARISLLEDSLAQVSFVINLVYRGAGAL